jgi:hypothetical protein
MEIVRGIGFPRHCRYVVKIYAPGQRRMLSAEFPQEMLIPVGGRDNKVLIVYRVASPEGSDSRAAGG